MDVALLVFLILLNGIFAMSEMALTASRKARLQVMVETGDSGAKAAMALHDDPTRFLSVVQIGITSIGILNGIVGEAAFSAPFAAWLRDTFGMQQGASDITATGMIVVTITFATIIFGELVPKRLGQMYPESVARLVAKPMDWLSILASPFVKLLAFSTVGTLALLGIKGGPSRSVTEEEIAAQLEEGLESGVIEAHEHQMVRNVFRLDDRQVGSMMIPRSEIVWLDVNQSAEEIMQIVSTEEHSRYPVCRNGLSDVVGVISAQTLLRQAVQGLPLALSKLSEGLQPCVFVPETLSGMELLEQFRASGAQLVMVVDEYGEVQGMITVRDVLEAIAGEFTTPTDDDAWAVSQGEGGWIFDGLIPVHELKDRLDLKELPEEDRGRYNTLAGMIMLLLGRLPMTGDTVDWENWRFQVVEMEGKRVDRVFATAIDENNSDEQATDTSNP
ncbi:hemolysin family protein [Piscinibacter sakaiensis]|uniref:hemolysin family protein n=1 Tax=Piscinibacter sakaiensis TaxID=1547922 RepID=UPI003AAE2574